MRKDQSLGLECGDPDGSRSESLRDMSGADSVKLLAERMALTCAMAVAMFEVVRNVRKSA